MAKKDIEGVVVTRRQMHENFEMAHFLSSKSGIHGLAGPRQFAILKISLVHLRSGEPLKMSTI